MFEKRWNKLDVNPSTLPIEMVSPWAGIFTIERKALATLDEQTLVAMLRSPDGFTDGVANVVLIYKLLQAMYQRQTTEERKSKSTSHVNGVGFNKFDSQFLTDVAQRSQKYKNLTPGQAAAVGKCLVKYKKQLMDIISHFQVKEKEHV